MNLQLTLMLWAAQFSGPVLAGGLWALATWMKWVPAPFWFVLAPRARGWGLVFLLLSASLSLLLLPLTILQLQALFGFGPRPLRLDYLVFLRWCLAVAPSTVLVARPSSGRGTATAAALASTWWRWAVDRWRPSGGRSATFGPASGGSSA
jgi:hypothetical protein